MIEQLSAGPGTAPRFGDHTWFNGAGMITTCPHGLVLREGWPLLPLNVTGLALVNLATREGRNVRRSSLPNHCDECAA